MDTLIGGIVAESSEPVVLGYSRLVSPMDAKDGVDSAAFDEVRRMRWPQGVQCTSCDSDNVAKRGFDETQKERQRYRCGDCQREFDDLTGTIFAGHHQPLRVWILCLYFTGLNLSNSQIAKELELDPDSAQEMATLLRNGILAKGPEVTLSGEVECDEVYIVAGHKGNPAAVKKKNEKGVGGV